MRHCKKDEFANFTTFTCVEEPTYVMTRFCTNQYYVAAGICCKFDETINFVANSNPTLFAKTKYLIQSDDDTYWRTDQLMRWLASIENAQVSHLPLVMNIEPSYTKEKMEKKATLWHIDVGCYEVRTNGWYQPIALNRAALEKIRVGTKEFGVTSTCKLFDMSQDSGIGIFLWMYKLYHIFMPGVQINPNHAGRSIFHPDQMMVHAVRHVPNDHCDGAGWPMEERYDQDMAIGCGKVGHPGPFHNPVDGVDMYDAWNYFEENGTDLVLEVPGKNDWISVKPDEPIFFTKGLEATRVKETTGRRRLVESISRSHGSKLLNDSTDARNDLVMSARQSHDEARSRRGLNDATTASNFSVQQHKHTQSRNTAEARILPYIVPLNGYELTEHSKKYDVTKKYVPFLLSDCVIPGKINKKNDRLRRLMDSLSNIPGNFLARVSEVAGHK